MQENNKKFDFDDILIIPKEQTNIESRFGNISPYVDEINIDRLPLFTAPMDSVLDNDNYHEFQENKIRVVLPRTIDIPVLDYVDPIFHSYSLGEFDDYYVRNLDVQYSKYVLIDIANGHMSKIIELAKKAKERRPDLVIMAGNIANPETYRWYAKSNVIDYVRVGIGNGNGCWCDGTKIMTINGLKNIEDIEINDQVLTHKGNYKPVTNKISYINEEPLININNSICTQEHEIFVVYIKDENLINENNYLEYGFWIEAKNIDSDIHLIVSIYD